MLGPLRRRQIWRVAALTTVLTYLGLAVGTYLHLGIHPHVYSPILNAFVHPDDDSVAGQSKKPLAPFGSSRTHLNKSDHSLQFALGCEMSAAPVIAKLVAVTLNRPRPAARPLHQRIVLEQAPKQSPPLA